MKFITIYAYLKSVIYYRNTIKQWEDFSGESATGYLDLLNGNSSDYLWDKLESSFPKSVLEIGCNSGSRIFSVAKQNPNTIFMGIDISKAAIKVAQEFAQNNEFSNTNFAHLDITDKHALRNFFQGKNYNMIFTWATLIYIHPSKIKQILKEMLNNSKEIFIIEQHNENLKFFYKGIPISGGKNWVRNYKKIIAELDKNKEVKVYNVPNDIWQPGGGHGCLVHIR